MPLAVLQFLILGPLLALVVGEMIAADPCTASAPCRAPLGSLEYWIATPLVSISLALPVLAAVAPRVAIWIAASVGAAVVIFDGASVAAPWIAAAAGWLALGVYEAALRVRQRGIARSWSAPHLDPPRSDRRPSPLDDTRLLASSVAVLLLVATVLLVAVHAQRLDDVGAFESRAAPANGTVTSGTDDVTVVDISGRSYVLGITAETYPRGSVVPVLVDPAGGRAELLAEPADPSWLIGLAALAVIAAVTVLVMGISRGRRLVALLAGGGPAITLDLSVAEWTVLGGGSPRREILIGLPHLLAPPASATTADVGLLARLGAAFDDEDDEDVEGDPEPCPQSVTVVGMLADGFPVLIRDDDHWYVSSRAVRDPWPWRRLAQLLRRRSG